MQFRVRENQGYDDKLDYDNDNDNGAKSILQWTFLTY
jgi:hypothetical protein